MDLLEVQKLQMFYTTLRGYVRAVDDVTFNVKKGHALGLAGESGCGKTSIALTILRMLPLDAKVMNGEILLENNNLLKMKNEEFRKQIRWKKISMIFQGAMNALHPFKKIGVQIAEPIMIHENVSKKEALERAGKLLDMVGIGAERIDRFPHELSGGMKQRTVIAMALSCNPTLVIADEPTTALDVITQAQILVVMKELQRKLNLSMIVISHDLSLIAEVCHETAIMYAGKVVEFGDAISIFKKPAHPYTQKLLSAFPDITKEITEITSIPGFPPDLLNPPSGCRFHPRCSYAMEECKKKEPKLIQVGKNHYVACHLVGE
jgi:peptide/nickel transport system ATP-binding protein